MKKLLLLGLMALPACAQTQTTIPADRPFFKSEAPPTVIKAETTPAPQPGVQPLQRRDATYVYDQKPLPGVPKLVTKEEADAVVKKFRGAYDKLGRPRIAIYVNRDLVDTESGTRLTSRTEKIDSNRSKVSSTVETVPTSTTPNSVTINAGRDVTLGNQNFENPGKGTIKRRTDNVRSENTYGTTTKKTTLTDRQTTRDIERLVGRPLRAGGAALADQRLLTQQIADRPLKNITTEGEQGRKDREAVKQIADVVVEILISSRNIEIPDVSGNKTYTAPDIQATAMRLSDSQIIGQSSSRDIIGQDRFAGRILRNFDVQEITEATALALMEDMAASAP